MFLFRQIEEAMEERFEFDAFLNNAMLPVALDDYYLIDVVEMFIETLKSLG